MVQPIPHAPDDPIGSPDELLRKKFPTVRRGLDADEVRSYLGQVAAALSDSRAREAELRSRLGKAVRRADQAEHLSEEDLTSRLGEEVAQVMFAAREASRERIEKSAAEAERTVTNAEDQAADIRGRAETVLHEQTEIAEAAAAKIRAEALADAEATRESARLTLEQSQQKAVENLDAARREGEGLIEQAEVARSQILGDMDRRRRTMRSQVELLKAGRDRLLESHDHLRKSLDEIGTELKVSVAEAKIKGESAERRSVESLLGTPQQLESELADAALIGLVHLPQVDRVPDLNPDALPAELREAVVAGTAETAAPAVKAKVNLPGAAPKAEKLEEVKPEFNKPEEKSTPQEVTPELKKPEDPSSGVPAIAIPKAAEPRTVAPKSAEPKSAESKTVEPTVSESPSTDSAPGLAAEDSSTASAHAAVGEPSKSPTPVVPVAKVPVAKVIVPDASASSHLKVVDAGPRIPKKKPPARPLVVSPVTQAPISTTPISTAPISSTPASNAARSEAPGSRASVASPAPAQNQQDDAAAAVNAGGVKAASAKQAEKQSARVEARRVDKRQVASEPQANQPEAGTATAPKKAAPKKAAPKNTRASQKAKKSSGIDALFANLRDTHDTPSADDTVSADNTVSAAADITASAAADITPSALDTAEVVDGAEADRSDEALARVRDAAVADLEQTIERRLKRVLADEQNDVMEFLRSTEYNGDATAAFPPEVTQIAAYFDAIRPQLEAAFGAGAAFAGSDTTMDSDSLSRVYDILRDGVVRPIRDRFSAVDTGSDADEVLQVASSFYRGHKTSQIRDHASWMALVAFSEGTLAGLEPGTGVRWAFNEHKGACPDGYDNSLSAPIQPGERFPSGNDIAPIGRHCRCVLVPADR